MIIAIFRFVFIIIYININVFTKAFAVAFYKKTERLLARYCVNAKKMLRFRYEILFDYVVIHIFETEKTLWFLFTLNKYSFYKFYTDF